MPFKNVTKPKTVASVEGDIVGASFNRKLGSVMMIGHNPVQVAIVGQSGSPSKVFAIGLGDVSDVSLLSRDMALVLENGTLWSLLDIAHKAKVEQVATDVAMLVGPQGEASLALKWDNSGVQLTPGKMEVATREFPMRGDIRSVSVGESECYVVVDGGDGEFRIHPGATPEQGSTAKTALPPGARALGRLSGGKFLSVLFQRGDANVCAIKRAGNRLEPKMLRLDGPVNDVVVAEGAFVAAMRDGRIVLFDDEAIDKGTASLIEPKAETSTGHEPRRLVVAGSYLFVGTSAGEVQMATLVRKSVMY